MRKLFLFIALVSLTSGCGNSYVPVEGAVYQSSVPGRTYQMYGSPNGYYGGYYYQTPRGQTQSTVQGQYQPLNGSAFDVLADRGAWKSCGNVSCAGGKTDGSGNYAYEGDTLHLTLFNNMFSDILWWKGAGNNHDATHVILEVSAMIDNPEMPQNLEFDWNQSRPDPSNPKGAAIHTVFGTQCNFYTTKRWDHWIDDAHGWAATSAPCEKWQAGRWNTIVWEFDRTQDGRAVYKALTFNGGRYQFNPPYVGGPPRFYNSHFGPDNVGLQIDGRGSPSTVNMWVKNVRVSRW